MSLLLGALLFALGRLPPSLSAHVAYTDLVHTLIFLHGLGDSPTAWDEVVASPLLADYRCLTLPLFAPELLDGWSIDKATDMLATKMGGTPAHIVGLSLGAIVALNTAIRYLQHVASLVLSAPQAKLPATLMRTQKVLMRLLPQRVICPPELTKRQLIAILDSLNNLDLTPGLSDINVPTTVACGAKDKANLRASQRTAAAIPNASLEIIADASHQWHTQMPQRFAQLIAHHLIHS